MLTHYLAKPLFIELFYGVVNLNSVWKVIYTVGPAPRFLPLAFLQPSLIWPAAGLGSLVSVPVAPWMYTHQPHHTVSPGLSLVSLIRLGFLRIRIDPRSLMPNTMPRSWWAHCIFERIVRSERGRQISVCSSGFLL